MIDGMFDWLLAALIAAVVSAAPAPLVDVDEIEPVGAEAEPAVWYDPTIGVYIDATPWAPVIGSYPTGDELGDVCVPDPRFPGFGTTKVGAVPCTPQA